MRTSGIAPGTATATASMARAFLLVFGRVTGPRGGAFPPEGPAAPAVPAGPADPPPRILPAESPRLWSLLVAETISAVRLFWNSGASRAIPDNWFQSDSPVK